MLLFLRLASLRRLLSHLLTTKCGILNPNMIGFRVTLKRSLTRAGNSLNQVRVSQCAMKTHLNGLCFLRDYLGRIFITIDP